MPARWQGEGEVQTIHVDGPEVTIAFPGGITVELILAGKSIDVCASVKGRPALVRSDVDARPQVTLDIVEARGPEE
jgi:hypothetical protein